MYLKCISNVSIDTVKNVYIYIHVYTFFKMYIYTYIYQGLITLLTITLNNVISNKFQ